LNRTQKLATSLAMCENVGKLEIIKFGLILGLLRQGEANFRRFQTQKQQNRHITEVELKAFYYGPTDTWIQNKGNTVFGPLGVMLADILSFWAKFKLSGSPSLPKKGSVRTGFRRGSAPSTIL